MVDIRMVGRSHTAFIYKFQVNLYEEKVQINRLNLLLTTKLVSFKDGDHKPSRILWVYINYVNVNSPSKSLVVNTTFYNKEYQESLEFRF